GFNFDRIGGGRTTQKIVFYVAFNSGSSADGENGRFAPDVEDGQSFAVERN
ncbi:Hypothetical predicted protein, partial [Olea europaea subsp. europaea]